ncbi:hypothetical protein [Thorsellia anophelis]|uniref:hypothetical protein n=1 Tax=Thorsellia anophelis TaxID=336804 RepID=UPI0015A5B78A|nr:hypothetical protein [Thorsellia anophelis]
MNTKDLRAEFEFELISMKLVEKISLKIYWTGEFYTKEHINDAWEEYQKEKAQAESLQVVQRNV